MRRFLTALFALCALVLPAATRAADVKTVDVGLISKTGTVWPIFVADAKGFFAKRGVKPNFIVAGSAAGSVQQLTAGSFGFGEASTTQIAEAIKGGAPVVYVLNSVITPPYVLMAKRGIKRLADLKGKTIIVGGVNDITRVFTDAMLKSAGLKPDDYTYTYAGATSARFAALKSGSVDAAILFPPFDFLAKDQGFVDLGTVQKYFPSFPFDGFAVNKAWAQKHHAEAVALVGGYLDGVRWMSNKANRNEASRILAQETGTSLTDAQHTYDALVTHFKAFSLDARTDAAGFQKVLDALVQIKAMSPPIPPATTFFDNRYANEANGRR